MPKKVPSALDMSGEEFNALLVRFGLTQGGFAKGLGYTVRAGQRWASGERPVPGAVSILLRLLVARPEILEVLRSIAPIVPAQRKPSGRRAPARKRAVK